jgi:hypothetical protein
MSEQKLKPFGRCAAISVRDERNAFDVNKADQHNFDLIFWHSYFLFSVWWGLGRSRQDEWGGQGMWHAWERRENCTRFWRESPKERDHSEDQGVGGRMGSEWILGRLAWGLDWIQLVRDRYWWWAVVSVVMNLWVLLPWSWLFFILRDQTSVPLETLSFCFWVSLCSSYVTLFSKRSYLQQYCWKPQQI